MTQLVEIPGVYDPGAVAAAEARVRTFCGWHIAPSRSETVILDGSGDPSLHLPSMLVTAVASVVEDGVTLAATEYSWSVSGVLERAAGNWTSKWRAVEVNLTHGYAECPDDIRREISRLSAAGYATPPDLSKDVLMPYQLLV